MEARRLSASATALVAALSLAPVADARAEINLNITSNIGGESSQLDPSYCRQISQNVFQTSTGACFELEVNTPEGCRYDVRAFRQYERAAITSIHQSFNTIRLHNLPGVGNVMFQCVEYVYK